MASENYGYRGLRTFFWCTAIGLGAADAWITRNTMNMDGISYLDIGDAYWRGDWHAAISAYWSPLYPWLLGLFSMLLKPSPYWEYPVVHLANFVIYLAALASFEFLMRAFIDHRRRSGNGTAEDGTASLPEWAWWTLGYSLFIWTSLVLITILVVSPDMCVAAFVYLASGLLLRMRSGVANWCTLVLLGAVLGFGYLAKAVMFPLAFVFLAVALFSLGRKGAPRVWVPAVAFLAIASPLIVVLSRAKGGPTFGAAGAVNYELGVNGVDLVMPKSTTLTHPVRRISELPPTYEFATPIPGTYPLWYDPSYWHTGLKPQVQVKKQTQALTVSAISYCWLFFSPFLQLNLTVGLVVLFLLAPRPSVCVKRVAESWSLLIPALSAFALYSLVHVEYRYLGPFVSLLWLSAFSGVRLPLSQGSRRQIAFVVVAVAVTTGALLRRSAVNNVALARRLDTEYWEAARALGEKGTHPGDKIAINADLPLVALQTFVARLARIQIIAEVERPESLSRASSPTQSQAIDALKKIGVKGILTIEETSRPLSGNGWQRLGNTTYYVNLLPAEPGEGR